MLIKAECKVSNIIRNQSTFLVNSCVCRNNDYSLSQSSISFHFGSSSIDRVRLAPHSLPLSFSLSLSLSLFSPPIQVVTLSRCPFGNCFTKREDKVGWACVEQLPIFPSAWRSRNTSVHPAAKMYKPIKEIE